MLSEVVVFDPEGILPDGKVLQQDERYFAALRRGVVMLPVLSSVMTSKPRNSLSPFTKTFFGDGAPVSAVEPLYVGRGALWLEKGHASVAWAGMLRHGPELLTDGMLRLVGDPSQPPLMPGPIVDGSGNRASVAQPAGREDTWTLLTGQVSCTTAVEAVYAFALHGWAREAKLAWFALSQTE